jgi:hypothetical protein
VQWHLPTPLDSLFLGKIRERGLRAFLGYLLYEAL